MAEVFIYEQMLGKTFTKVTQVSDDELVFVCEDGAVATFYHQQDCCESVFIEDIVGDLSDLENSPLLEAEEVVTHDGGNWSGSATHSWYKFSTLKGSVVVRWCGESNGYYSESVDFKLEGAEKWRI